MIQRWFWRKKRKTPKISWILIGNSELVKKNRCEFSLLTKLKSETSYLVHVNSLIFFFNFGRKNLENLWLTCKYGRLLQHIYSPFRYWRVQELFRMTNIWNDNNSKEMTIIWKEWQKSGRNDRNLEGMTLIRKEWH